MSWRRRSEVIFLFPIFCYFVSYVSLCDIDFHLNCFLHVDIVAQSFLLWLPFFSHFFCFYFLVWKLIIDAKMHFESFGSSLLRSWFEKDRANTTKCTCERQRVPLWTNKRFAMCETDFFHSLLICFRNLRKVFCGSGDISECSREGS